MRNVSSSDGASVNPLSWIVAVVSSIALIAWLLASAASAGADESSSIQASVLDDWVAGNGLPAFTAMAVTVDHGAGAVSLPAVSTDSNGQFDLVISVVRICWWAM